MSSRRALLVAPLVAASLLVAACGGGAGAASGSTPMSSTSSSTSAATSVAIDTFMFMPKRISVRVGDTVTWTNGDNILHTVTSGMRDYDPSDSGRIVATHKDGLFDVQLDGKGATAGFTFAKAGTFHYFCDRHPGMEADIDVS